MKRPEVRQVQLVTRTGVPLVEQVQHTCHAFECWMVIQPRLLMCRTHWALVPRPFQKLIWATYRPGQEKDKQPSAAYLAVQRCCVNIVASREAVQKAGEEQGRFFAAAHKAHEEAISWAKQAEPIWTRRIRDAFVASRNVTLALDFSAA